MKIKIVTKALVFGWTDIPGFRKQSYTARKCFAKSTEFCIF